VTRLAPALLVLCLVPIAAGCGGGDNGSSKSTATNGGTSGSANGPSGATGGTGATGPGGGGQGSGRTRAPSKPTRRVIAEQDKRCRKESGGELRTERQLDRILQRLNPQQAPQGARISGQAIELLRAQRAELVSLRVAATDKPRLQRLLAVYDRRIAILTSFRAALLRRDLGGALALQGRLNAYRNLQRAAAQNFGFKVCGIASAGPGAN
jgi:hypothetical protein